MSRMTRTLESCPSETRRARAGAAAILDCQRNVVGIRIERDDVRRLVGVQPRQAAIAAADLEHALTGKSPTKSNSAAGSFPSDQVGWAWQYGFLSCYNRRGLKLHEWQRSKMIEVKRFDSGVRKAMP